MPNDIPSNTLLTGFASYGTYGLALVQFVDPTLTLDDEVLLSADSNRIQYNGLIPSFVEIHLSQQSSFRRLVPPFSVAIPISLTGLAEMLDKCYEALHPEAKTLNGDSPKIRTLENLSTSPYLRANAAVFAQDQAHKFITQGVAADEKIAVLPLVEMAERKEGIARIAYEQGDVFTKVNRFLTAYRAGPITFKELTVLSEPSLADATQFIRYTWGHPRPSQKALIRVDFIGKPQPELKLEV